MRTAPCIPSGHTGETDSPSEFRRSGHERAYDPREHFATTAITAEEMRAANVWARAHPRGGILPVGVRDALAHEYDVASHALDGRAHVQWDVWHEQLFNIGRALESARVAVRFP